MGGSISSLEKEILQIKSEQTKLESLGKTSESEQKRIEQQLAHSAELLKTYKESWNKQLESHAKEVNQLVQKQVQEALAKRKAATQSDLDTQLKALKDSDSATLERMNKTFGEYQT